MMSETDALQKIADKPLAEMSYLEYAVWRLYIYEDNKSAIKASNELARLTALEAVADKLYLALLSDVDSDDAVNAYKEWKAKQ